MISQERRTERIVCLEGVSLKEGVESEFLPPVM